MKKITKALPAVPGSKSRKDDEVHDPELDEMEQVNTPFIILQLIEGISNSLKIMLGVLRNSENKISSTSSY
jgi:hypothetical protein